MKEREVQVKRKPSQFQVAKRLILAIIVFSSGVNLESVNAVNNLGKHPEENADSEAEPTSSGLEEHCKFMREFRDCYPESRCHVGPVPFNQSVGNFWSEVDCVEDPSCGIYGQGKYQEDRVRSVVRDYQCPPGFTPKGFVSKK